MNNRFKGIGTLVLAVGLALAASLPAKAQIGFPSQIITSGISWTNSIDPSQTETGSAVMDCTKGTTLCIQLKAALSGAGTTACNFTLQGSADNSNWTSTTPASNLTIQWTPSGTTPVIVVTNIPVGAVPYMRIRTIVNGANTGSITNYTVKYWVK